MKYRIVEIADFFNANCTSELSNILIDHVEIDSRHLLVPEHTLFIAIKGTHRDGHEYIPELIDRGVRVFIVSDPKYIDHQRACFILVNDTVTALQEFAKHHRKSFQIPIIAVTGSNGKTIIKEWLSIILSKQYKVCKNPKSYNSQIGVALSLLELDETHQVGIFEAGISQQGEMQTLEKMIQPQYGILSNIGDAHQSGFETIESKLYEKLKLFESSSQLILHQDIIDTFHIKPFNGLVIGEKKDAQFLILDKKKLNNHTAIKLQYQAKQYQFDLHFIDEASIENALSAIAMSILMNMDELNIQKSLDEFQNLAMRLEVKEGLRQCTLINDSYSLDLKSLELALRLLDQQDTNKNRVLIISDFASLSHEETLFNKLIHFIQVYRITKVVTVGSIIGIIKNYLPVGISHFHYFSTEELIARYHEANFQNEVILLKGARKFQFEKFFNEIAASKHDAILEIDLKALDNNIKKIKDILPYQTKIMLIVKAAAYGSGNYEIAQFLEKKKVDYFAVAYADEGLLLREKGITTPILVMNTGSSDFKLMADHHLEPEIYSLYQCKKIESELPKNYTIAVHVKLDTGMHRLGFIEQDIEALIHWFKSNPNVHVKSIFSHLAASDLSEHDEFTQFQNQKFKSLSSQIIKSLGYTPMLHLLNSNGIMRFSHLDDYRYDLVRIGIGMYGVGLTSDTHGMEKVHCLKAKVIQVKSISKGESISYNRSGLMQRTGRIAIISIGYSDGIPRSLSGEKYKFFINGHYVPLIGVVCMDFCMIDISDYSDIHEEMEVEIFGKNASLSDLSRACATIDYEILTGISSRVKRIFILD